jgi:hypothetical protein
VANRGSPRSLASGSRKAEPAPGAEADSPRSARYSRAPTPRPDSTFRSGRGGARTRSCRSREATTSGPGPRSGRGYPWGSGIVRHLAHKPSSVPDARAALSPLEPVVDPHTFETLRFDSGVKAPESRRRGVTTCQVVRALGTASNCTSSVTSEQVPTRTGSHPRTSPRRDAERSLRNRSQRATSTRILALDGVRGSGVVVCVTERRRRPMTSSDGCPPLLYR